MKSRLKNRHLKHRKRFGKVGNKQHLNNQPITKAECSQKSVSVFRRLWNFLCFIISALFGNHKQKTFTESFKNESFINQRIEDLENKMQKMSKQIKLIQKELEKKTSLIVAPPCAPPPPPPPPPPPVAPPAKVALPASKSIVPKSSAITACDLKSIKLKKSLSSKISNLQQSSQLVTLKDLQNIQLKRRQPSHVGDNEQHILKTPKLSHKLKKTNLVRSPGGTPLVKQDLEHTTGDGLTPAFTQALRKKFKAFQANSPVKEASPGCWRC